MKLWEISEKLSKYQAAVNALIDVHDLYQADKYRKAINDLRNDIHEIRELEQKHLT